MPEKPVAGAGLLHLTASGTGCLCIGQQSVWGRTMMARGLWTNILGKPLQSLTSS